MYLWRRLASIAWWERNEPLLRLLASEKLALIEQPPRTKLAIEVVCASKKQAGALTQTFGGGSQKLPVDWLKHFARAAKTQPIRIGRRLTVVNEGKPGPARLVIPAGPAFGTGEHATTAMSLRLLEEVARGWGARAPSPAPGRASRDGSSISARRRNQPARRVLSPEFSLADLGTGSGILALAGRIFGARNVYGIDHDPGSISTAKANARLNRIRGVEFRVADARKWRPRTTVEVVTANLYSELLIETLPNVRRYLPKDAWLILSGVLRQQEPDVREALKRNGFRVVNTRRRGRWMAVLCRDQSNPIAPRAKTI